jgi:alpha-L-fucosidase
MASLILFACMLQSLRAHPAGSSFSVVHATPPPPPPPAPSADILAWTDREIGMFLCFDMITVLTAVPNPQHFCMGANGDRGFPLPPPSAYAPVALNTDAWLAAAVALGAKYTILVAQHCSGFSQWPSDILAATGFNYTYTTAHSPGAPNVVESYVASSQRAGVATGLYYSLNENYYLNVGGGRAGYAPLAPGQVNVSQDLYNRVAVAQMTELWSRHAGEFSELWFDGGDDLPGVNDAIARYQPQAVYFSGSMKKNNLRWVGTEHGTPQYPVWSTTDEEAGGQPTAGAGNPLGAMFAPAETDTTLSTHGGWFWKPGYSYRTLQDLQQVYHDSVGANSNLLLNLAVGADGGVPAPAQALYQALGDWVRRCYGTPAASVAPPPGNVVTLALPGGGVAVDRVVVMEDQSAGAQVLAYSVSVQVTGGAWLPAGEGQAIGHKRIHIFPTPAQMALAVRVNVTATRVAQPVAWRAFAAIDGAAQC